MRLTGTATARASAKSLRQSMSPPEVKLWLALRRSGLRFRRQHTAGPYVLDFFCAPARLAIEVDGEAHNRGNRPARDDERDAWLECQGVLVMRFAASDVMTQLDAVVRQIMAIAEQRCLPSRAPPSAPSGSLG